MSPNNGKPTVESLQKDIYNLSKRIQENEDKFRALLQHFNLYLDSEITMRSFKVKSNGIRDCESTGVASSGVLGQERVG